MKKIAILGLGLLAVSGCGRDSKAPTGQVVATIAGQEITTSELNAEIGTPAPDPAQAKAQQQAVLQQILTRKALANAARARDLDNTPAAAMLKTRAEEMALAQLLEQSIVAKAPKVSPGEVDAYITEHPANFSQRQLITADQVIVPQVPANFAKDIEPLKTMGEITGMLDSRRIAYRQAGAVIDTLMIDPRAVEQIRRMNVGDTFATLGNPGVVVSAIRDKRDAPLSGAMAREAATAIITQQRSAGQAQQQLASIIRDAQKSIKINAQYQPTPPAKRAQASAAK